MECKRLVGNNLDQSSMKMMSAFRHWADNAPERRMEKAIRMFLMKRFC